MNNVEYETLININVFIGLNNNDIFIDEPFVQKVLLSERHFFFSPLCKLVECFLFQNAFHITCMSL